MPEAVISQEKYAGWKNQKNTQISLLTGAGDKAKMLAGVKRTVPGIAQNAPNLQREMIQPRIRFDVVPQVLDTQHFIPSQDRKVSVKEKRPSECAGTAAWISYFDNNWRQENLPKDWFNLKSQQSNKRVGFIMDRQMDMLKDPFDHDALSDWTTKTKRDLEGFKLEFLSDNVVYPRKYLWNPLDKKRLEDPLYGKAKDGTNYAKISEIVSVEERNGSVVESLERIQEFLSTAPDGAIAVMTSPLGPTGFKTADGLAIDYPDSYFFVMQINGDEVMNYTIKTDFSLKQSRNANAQLTGRQLPENASLEDYARAVAFIKPGEHPDIRSVDDVITVLENTQPSHAFIDKQNNRTANWDDVRDQIRKGEELYQFDFESTAAINEFGEYANEGNHIKEKLRKGISATILRLGELFFRQEPTHEDIVLAPAVWQEIGPKKLFGTVLEQTAERRGCSGGGSSASIVSSLIPRLGNGGLSNEDEYGSLEFECTNGHRNTRPRGILIPNCTTCGESVAC